MNTLTNYLKTLINRNKIPPINFQKKICKYFYCRIAYLLLCNMIIPIILLSSFKMYLMLMWITVFIVDVLLTGNMFMFSIDCTGNVIRFFVYESTLNTIKLLYLLFNSFTRSTYDIAKRCMKNEVFIHLIDKEDIVLIENDNYIINSFMKHRSGYVTSFKLHVSIQIQSKKRYLFDIVNYSYFDITASKNPNIIHNDVYKIIESFIGAPEQPNNLFSKLDITLGNIKLI